jgi:hypothetical protein
VFREFGLPGVALRPGDHLCVCHVGAAERDAVLVPFAEAALRDGDRCVVAAAASALPARLDPALDPPGCLAGRQLVPCDPPVTHVRDGRFRPDRSAEFWEEQAAAALRDGYELARMVEETAWPGGDVDRRAVVEHAAWAQRFAAGRPLVLLTFYDLGRLGAGVLVDLVRTHPRVLLGGVLLENPHHLTAGELAGALP